MKYSSVVLFILFCGLSARAQDVPVPAESPNVPDSDFPEPHNSPAEAHLSPMSAAEATTGIKLPDGFHAELFASEPDVQNPIAMAWDGKGRLWVAENYTYSDRTQRFDLSLRDRVLIFEDADNDGKADSRTVFTDNVQMLTSVEVGHGGAWLMCPPRLLFIPDQNGDDVPDAPAQVVLDGFDVAQSNYHNFANGLRWGPDGWLYGRCGHSCPGLVGKPGSPDELRTYLDGGIWRYHPELETFEVLCHGTVNPWGHDWDKNGELFFINTVIGHVWHVMPGAHFTESFGESRNPQVYERMDTIADHFHFDVAKGWGQGRDGKANDFGGGHAHIGMMIYQADHWPERYRDKLFTLNMHGRRANVERLERLGAGFVARHDPDFFLSPDPFFRGIDIRTAPDGNVFVIDWSDTGECHESNGVHRTSGRIFKISYGEQAEPGPVVKPPCLAGPGRLPRLWRRYQAGETTRSELRQLLQDPDERIRVWAIRLLTDFWPLDTIIGPRADVVYPDDVLTQNALIQMASEDSSSLVKLTLASTIQRFPTSLRCELAKPLIGDAEFAEDRDMPLLVWYGLIPAANDDPIQVAELATQSRWPKLTQLISRDLASKIKSRPEALDTVLKSVEKQSYAWQDAVLAGMRDAFRGWQSAPQPKHWKVFREAEAGKQSPELVRELDVLFGDGRAMESIREIVFDSRADLQIRKSALESLITARPDDLRGVCESLMRVRSLNAVAAKGLVLFDDDEAAELLAESFRRFHPDDRPALMETLVSRPRFARALLDAVADSNGRSGIRSSDISAFHARQIRSLGDEALNRKLAEAWGEIRVTPEERQKQIRSLRAMLSTNNIAPPNLANGRRLFESTCATCHVLYGRGKAIGPELTGSQRNNLDYLLENILDPSAVVGKDYRMKTVLTTDGRVLNGLIVSRDKETMILQSASEQHVIPSADVEAVRETTMSSMPDGLLQNFTFQQIADLIGYLRHPHQVSLVNQDEE